MKNKSRAKTTTGQSKQKTSAKINLYFVVIFAMICYTAISLYLSAAEIRELKKERAQINVLIEEEENKQLTISSEKHYYESDSYIEKTAREQLGLVKSNDVIFIDKSSK